MGWFQPIIDIIQFIWPFRIVKQWEVAGWYVFGKFKGVTGPGLKVVCPWFIEIREETVVPAIVSTPARDITLSDDQLLHFGMSAWCKVTDYNLAINTVDQFRETVQESITAVVADKLAKMDSKKLAPDRRTDLLRSLREAVNAETSGFGVEVTKLRFTTFVLNPRAIRLIGNSADIMTW